MMFNYFVVTFGFSILPLLLYGKTLHMDFR